MSEITTQNKGLSQNGKIILTVVFLILFPIVGIILMFVWKLWPVWLRVLITIIWIPVSFILFIALIFGGIWAAFTNSEKLNITGPREDISNFGVSIIKPDGWEIKYNEQLDKTVVTNKSSKKSIRIYYSTNTSFKHISTDSENWQKELDGIYNSKGIYSTLSLNNYTNVNYTENGKVYYFARVFEKSGKTIICEPEDASITSEIKDGQDICKSMQ